MNFFLEFVLFKWKRIWGKKNDYNDYEEEAKDDENELIEEKDYNEDNNDCFVNFDVLMDNEYKFLFKNWSLKPIII